MHRDGGHRRACGGRGRGFVRRHARHSTGFVPERIGDVGLHQRSGLRDDLVDELGAGHEHVIPAGPRGDRNHPGELRGGALVGGLQQQGFAPVWEGNHDALLFGGCHAGAALEAVERLEGHEAAVSPCGG